MNLRLASRKNLIHTERAWGLLIRLTSPDGIVYQTAKDHGGPLKTLQTLTDFKRLDPESGEEILVTFPVVSIRLDALERVPKANEKWHVKVQMAPIDADLKGMTFDQVLSAYPTFFADYMLDGSRAPEGGRSIGFTRLYLQYAEQLPEV